MNFEAKHLIRWGIPGWIYITIILTYFIIELKEELTSYLISININNIGLSALLAGGGIIIGHLIHQISILLGFVVWTNKKAYFNNEYKIDKLIINSNNGKEIQRIYSHRLGQVHAIRALLTSSILSLVTLIVLIIYNSITVKSIWILGLNIILIVILFFNHLYFKQNLDFFISKIKRDF